MKKLIQTLAVLFLTLSLSAQYKKASFFEKSGRTYEFGTRMFMMKDGKGSPLGYTLGFGRDREGKQFFSSWELQLIPAYSYTYNTVDENDQPLTVNGKANTAFIYSPNYGYHLLKNTAGRKVQPYVLAGLNIVLASGANDAETYTPEPYGYPKRQTSLQTLSVGLNGGLGCLVNFSQKFGLKLQGGYDRQFNMSTTDWDDAVKPFFLITSHPYVSAALRLRIIKD